MAANTKPAAMLNIINLREATGIDGHLNAQVIEIKSGDAVVLAKLIAFDGPRQPS